MHYQDIWDECHRLEDELTAIVKEKVGEFKKRTGVRAVSIQTDVTHWGNFDRVKPNRIKKVRVVPHEDKYGF